MTVSSTTTKVSLTAGTNQHSFAYSFKIFADADLVVIIRDAAGAETTKTLNTHYVVTGAGSDSGGNVLFKYNTGDTSDAHYSATDNRPANGETVVIKRSLTLTQGTDYVANDPFAAEDHETALDRLTFISQQQQEEIDRAFKVSPTNTITSADFTGDATSRANKVLSFDASGDLIASQELGVFRGTDATTTTTAYNVRDLVKSTTTAQLNNVYIALQDSPSGTLLTNTSYWALVVDAVSAASSAATATSQAGISTTKAGESSTSASTAETHKNDAQTAKTAAETAKTAAETAQAAAETALDTFDDRFLGAKSSDPSVDNDGNALVDGALYFDTTNDLMKVYDLTNTVWRQLALTGTNQTNVNTVAGQISPTNNIATVAGDSSNIQTLATDLSGSDTIGTVATSITNVNTVATNIANVNTAASNIAGINSFGERYRVGSSDPTSSLDAGDLFFNTTSNQYKFYDGSSWQVVNVSGLGNIVEDTSPQLGGNLDVQTSSIVSVSDRDINITPNGTGSVVLDGIKYPQSDGTSNQFLKTDGSGQLGFATVATDVVGDSSPQLGGDLDGNGNTIDLSANTSALGIPVGTTAQRPGSSANGDIRINTTIGTLEFYNNGNWSQTNYVPVVNSVTGSIIASVASDLTIAVTNATATMDVVYKEGGTTLATTSDVDFSTGSATTAVPAAVYGQTAGDTITVSVIDNLGVPSSNSVSKTVAAEATGGTITRSGGKTIHTFTSSGTFTIPSGSTFSCDILVVAGGGGGNPAGGGGGGGGAGGFRKFTSQSLAAGARTVTVGAGGAARTGSYVTATNKGSESKFDDGGGGELAATGGGGGKSDSTSGAVNNGGSGGGGSGGHMTAGGTGNEGGYTPSEGNNGGNGAGSAYAGGGGGGAGAVGSNGAAPVGGAGGVGVSDSITGSAVFYAGGGGGGGINSGGTSSGGNGGGGSGSSVSGSGVSGSGTANTGGGGGGGPGGGGSATSGAGGSGVVIISYTP